MLAPLGTPLAALERYRRSFPGPHLDLVCASLQAGHTLGHLWVLPQDLAHPLLLLWDKGNNVFYLAGEEATASGLAQCRALLTPVVRPQALADGAPQFRARALAASLDGVLPRLFAPVVLQEYPVLFSVYDAPTPPRAIPPPALPAVAILPLTRQRLRESGLTHSAEVRAEIRGMWPTEEQFFTHGFGTLAILQDTIVGWCTAEYVGPQRCGLGIATQPAYQRRGVATALAAAFVGEALRRGLTPCWECGRTNGASVRVAEKVGFVPQADETYWAGSFAR
jgi:GNAT superfamily N-acetyltransferase